MPAELAADQGSTIRTFILEMTKITGFKLDENDLVKKALAEGQRAGKIDLFLQANANFFNEGVFLGRTYLGKKITLKIENGQFVFGSTADYCVLNTKLQGSIVIEFLLIAESREGQESVFKKFCIGYCDITLTLEPQSVKEFDLFQGTPRNKLLSAVPRQTGCKVTVTMGMNDTANALNSMTDLVPLNAIFGPTDSIPGLRDGQMPS